MLETQCHFPRDADGRPSGGTGVDGRQLTSERGGGSKEFVPEGNPPPAPKGAQLNALEGLPCGRTNTTTEDCQWSTESCIKGQG